ncbi:MAG: endonuclease III [Bacteroidales bacterium]
MLSTKERFRLVIDYFSKNKPIAETELHYRNPFQLLVAVILSAQCTDKRVNIITPPFFNKFPDAVSLSLASQEEIYDLIKSCSYPNNKAKNLLGMAKGLLEMFNGNMPDDIDDLQKLPGVGRKTANVIASVVFKKPAMAVDTHVFRVSERIGLTTNSKNPLETEKQLIKYIPKEKIPIAHHWLILHGRYVCIARKPKCEECELKELCRYYKKNV